MSNSEMTEKDHHLPVVSNATQHYVRASVSENTRKAYKSDLQVFSQWAKGKQLASLPATSSTVADFLSSQADSGIRSTTLSRRLSAIRYAHKANGFASPTDDALVRATLTGIKRTQKKPVEKKSAATIDLIHRLLAQCDTTTLRGKRDHAFLLMGFSGAFRRSELIALIVSDVEQNQHGFTVLIRKSKTDQEAEGQKIAIPNGRLRIVDSLNRWLNAASITKGAIFRKISKGGLVGSTALSDKSVNLIVKKYAALAGLDSDMFAGHSLRSGFTTSAAEAGANLFKIMDVTRHKSVETVREYVSSADAFKDHAGDSFL